MSLSLFIKYFAFICLAVIISFYQLAFLKHLNLLIISIILIALFFKDYFVYTFALATGFIVDIIYYDIFLFNFISYLILSALIIFFLKNLVSKYSLYSLLFLLIASLIFQQTVVYLFHFNTYYWQDIIKEMLYSSFLFIITYYIILLYNPRFKPVFLKK